MNINRKNQTPTLKYSNPETFTFFWILIFLNVSLSLIIVIIFINFWKSREIFNFLTFLIFLIINFIGYYKTIITNKYIRLYFDKNTNKDITTSNIE
ncbi:MAG TPA: hypothetical protein DHW42_08720 [Candidatus Marinimicrobia bacterium]|nr:hypothetical protein [Candidatus Neomarinimicrobiota bacterium]